MVSFNVRSFSNLGNIDLEKKSTLKNMISFPQNCSDFLFKLIQKVKNAPPEDASEALYQAGTLFILSGFGDAAYESFLYLLEGELSLSKASSLMHSFESILLPSLCYALSKPCPATSNREALTTDELTDLVLQNEQQNRFMLLMDRFSLPEGNLPPEISKYIPKPPPLNPNWTEEYIQKLLGQGENAPTRNEISSFLQEAYRVLQVLAKGEIFDEAIELSEVYNNVCEIWKLDNSSIYADVEMIAIDTCFRAGKEVKAKERFTKWWRQSRQSTVSLFTLLYFRSGINTLLDGVLREEIGISQAQINIFFDALKNRSYVPQTLYIPSVSDWQTFLETWNSKIFARKLDEDLENYSHWFPDEVEKRDCGSQGALESEILELELKLGKSLPTSYRNFLLCSNGWIIVNEYDKLLATKEIDWFYTLNKEWVDVWNEGERYEVNDEKYFFYGKHQDAGSIRSYYMKTALQISTDEDGYVYLLNPIVVNEQGEWEAWDFGNKIAGAYRYRSFWEMMQAIYKRSFEDEND